VIRHGFRLESQDASVPGVRDPQTQCELLQEVFLRAFSRQVRERYDGLRPYRPYLLQITRNLLVDRFRKTAREVSTSDPLIDLDRMMFENTEPQETLDTDPEWLAQVRACQAYLAGASEQVRLFVKLRFAAEQSQESVADALGLTRKQVRTLELRVRKELAAYLLEQEGPVASSARTEAMVRTLVVLALLFGACISAEERAAKIACRSNADCLSNQESCVENVCMKAAVEPIAEQVETSPVETSLPPPALGPTGATGPAFCLRHSDCAATEICQQAECKAFEPFAASTLILKMADATCDGLAAACGEEKLIERMGTSYREACRVNYDAEFRSVLGVELSGYDARAAAACVADQRRLFDYSAPASPFGLSFNRSGLSLGCYAIFQGTRGVGEDCYADRLACAAGSYCAFGPTYKGGHTTEFVCLPFAGKLNTPCVNAEGTLLTDCGAGLFCDYGESNTCQRRHEGSCSSFRQCMGSDVQGANAACSVPIDSCPIGQQCGPDNVCVLRPEKWCPL
jgi:RNA polymerase sigma factor (sigma-70 family)